MLSNYEGLNTSSSSSSLCREQVDSRLASAAHRLAVLAQVDCGRIVYRLPFSLWGSERVMSILTGLFTESEGARLY